MSKIEMLRTYYHIAKMFVTGVSWAARDLIAHWLHSPINDCTYCRTEEFMEGMDDPWDEEEINEFMEQMDSDLQNMLDEGVSDES